MWTHLCCRYVGSTGPLSICVDASKWQTYKGGVLRGCGDRIDHCVQAVGIDTDKGIWKVKIQVQLAPALDNPFTALG